MSLYAAYGSNLDPEQMSQRCPSSPSAGVGWVRGWRLTFGGEELGWEGALATIVPDEIGVLFVALYDLTRADATRLDEWESVPSKLYDRIKLRVQTTDGDRTAWTYVLNAFEGGLPSARYLGVLADAAERAGAPDDYVAGLRNRPCRTS